MSESTNVLKLLLEDIQASEVKTTPLSRQPYYNFHTTLYKVAVDQAAAELAQLRAIEAAALPVIEKMIELYNSNPDQVDASDELEGYRDVVANNYLSLTTLLGAK